jgi:hypothetical protein
MKKAGGDSTSQPRPANEPSTEGYQIAVGTQEIESGFTSFIAISLSLWSLAAGDNPEVAIACFDDDRLRPKAEREPIAPSEQRPKQR